MIFRKIYFQFFIILLIFFAVVFALCQSSNIRAVRGAVEGQTAAGLERMAALTAERIERECFTGGRLDADAAWAVCDAAARRFFLTAALTDKTWGAVRVSEHGGSCDIPWILSYLRENRIFATSSRIADGGSLIYGFSPARAPLGGEPAVTVIFAERTGAPDALIRELNGRLATVFAVVSALTLIILFARFRGLSKQIDSLSSGAARMARGETDTRIPLNGGGPLDDLAESINETVSRMSGDMLSLRLRLAALESVFSSMRDSVIALDPDARVISVNKAAEALLCLASNPAGRTIHEVARHPALLAFVEKILRERESAEAEFSLFSGDRELLLRAFGGALRDFAGGSGGAIVVLSDITRLRKLEKMRSEFVSNVSHEIRTPITAIKGAVEALLDGPGSPEDTEKFMKIILRHTDRLNALVEDILSLSRIESESLDLGASPVPVPLEPVIKTAAELCGEKAELKKITLRVSCGDWRVLADKPLLEQALVNLIDNAVKYSAEGSAVDIRADAPSGGMVTVHVIDSGCGIPREHIPRLFERFYRVDKARSRKLGGTGLGLAIVKHIVQLHKGRVSVESSPGKGSDFSVSIPAA
jgi:two-component system phosphate regulon sensor histidine kinase PhoR